MKKILNLSFLLLVFGISFAQETEEVEIRRNTLSEQMQDAFDKSNSYQEYKVIKKTQLASLRTNILDSVARLERQISSQDSEIGLHKTEVDSLKQNLSKTQEDLKTSIENEDGIKVLGILTSKSAYNSVMWSIILFLLVAAGFLFYRFLNSAKITNAAQLKMAEMEIEIEDYRRNSLEREQKLRRKLQDEINKNRKI